MTAERAPAAAPERVEAEVAALRRAVDALRAAVATRFRGQAEVVDELVLGLLAEGHVLLEGPPGLGKTTLVRALADALDLQFRRIQFTPDLMPADVTGTRILDEDERGARRFRFQRGPIFAQVLLADEINRATPRTQAALLEAMQERQVTVFGETLPLDAPFYVVATQNPIEMEGTYPLPEAQLDRFLLEVRIALPPHEELVDILRATTGREPAAIQPVVTREQVLAWRELVRDVLVRGEALERVARALRATHPADPSAPESVRRHVRHGVSPRGGQAWILAAKARALLAGRLHVADEDLAALAAPALRHRILLGYEGEAAGASTDELARAAWERAGRG